MPTSSWNLTSGKEEMCIRDSRVEYETLYRLVLNKIRECAKAALMDGEAVAGDVYKRQ